MDDSGRTVVDAGPPSIRRLLSLTPPAIFIGVASAVMLYLLEALAHLAEDAVWNALPRALGVDPFSGWWIFGVLSLTGLSVGLVVWRMPGHGGTDSATVELVGPPLPLGAVPSLVAVGVLGLAGGVSLGPESPAIAINTAVLVAVVSSIWRTVPLEMIVMATVAATIGAMFGTPVAAALVFTGIVGSLAGGGALWDRLFLPLLCAGAGAVTMSLLVRPDFSLPLPAYPAIAPIDLVSASVVAVVAALVGIGAAAVFPALHRAFRLLGNPVVYVTAGGMLLGLLGLVGGPVTLFKGLHQGEELVVNRADYEPGELVLVVVVKVAALLVAAAAGFRGGRIFPAVFVGTAIGVLANALVPGVPVALAVAAGVLGMVLAVSRDGWIALFIAATISGGVTVLPVLCIAVLPAWLFVSRAPEMIVHAPPREAEGAP